MRRCCGPGPAQPSLDPLAPHHAEHPAVTGAPQGRPVARQFPIDGQFPGSFAVARRLPSVGAAAIPGVVFAEEPDGHIRAYDAADGRITWDFETPGVTETANRVPGVSGAIDGPGPVIAGGMLFTNSGCGPFGQMPGNLLLAFVLR